MAKSVINPGTANQGDGDPLRNAFVKVISNTDEVYEGANITATAPLAKASVADTSVTLSLADDGITFAKLGVEYTASSPLTSGTAVPVNTALGDVFTMTTGHAATLNFTNVGIGDMKTLIITSGGAYSVALGTVNTASCTFNLISGTYSQTGSAKNLIQIKWVATNEAWYTISQIAS